ncbi:hypothetical protein E6A50_09105, partial [Brachyspira hampsonii]|nr:hypothetical protein [Brachyspira hampsonii]
EDILSDMPTLENVSQIFVEEKETLKDELKEEFVSLRNEILGSVPTNNDLANMAQQYGAKIRDDFQILEQDFSESIK